MEILENLEPLLRTFWLIAIPTSLVFAFQSILTFVGSDFFDGGHGDFGDHLDGADTPFLFFSLRNLTNFLLGFSWSGISFYNAFSNKTLLVLLSIVVGALFVALFFIIIQQIQKLAEDNSFKFSETLNKTAEVYLTIPERKNGQGKILISINGSVHQLDAMTEGTKIESGKIVKVVKVESNSILIVENL